MPDRAILIVDGATTRDDLVQFLLARAAPLRLGGSRIWDLNNHLPLPAELAASAVPPGDYLIPFSMSEIHADLCGLLPAAIAGLPRLRYDAGRYRVVPCLVPPAAGATRAARATVEAAYLAHLA